jgi:hypothetical protein
MAARTKPFIINRMPGFGTIAIIMFVMLYAPIILLIVFSFNERESVAVWGGLSTRWYEAAWNDREIKDAAVPLLCGWRRPPPPSRPSPGRWRRSPPPGRSRSAASPPSMPSSTCR